MVPEMLRVLLSSMILVSTGSPSVPPTQPSQPSSPLPTTSATTTSPRTKNCEK